MKRDSGRKSEVGTQDSVRKKIKVNLSVLGVFVVQGFFTAKTRRARRVFCWFMLILQEKQRISIEPSPDGRV